MSGGVVACLGHLGDGVVLEGARLDADRLAADVLRIEVRRVPLADGPGGADGVVLDHGEVLLPVARDRDGRDSHLVALGNPGHDRGELGLLDVGLQPHDGGQGLMRSTS